MFRVESWFERVGGEHLLGLSDRFIKSDISLADAHVGQARAQRVCFHFFFPEKVQYRTGLH